MSDVLLDDRERTKALYAVMTGGGPPPVAHLHDGKVGTTLTLLVFRPNNVYLCPDARFAVTKVTAPVQPVKSDSVQNDVKSKETFPAWESEI